MLQVMTADQIGNVPTLHIVQEYPQEGEEQVPCSQVQAEEEGRGGRAGGGFNTTHLTLDKYIIVLLIFHTI